MKCILRERLYVPEAWVTPEHIANFTYFFENREIKRDEIGRAVDVETTLEEIKTVARVKNPNDGQYYYGFARGNLVKLKDLFGQYEWEDRTVAPPMVSDLRFRDDRHLRTYEKDGVGQQEVVAEMLRVKHGIIKAAPRFGKTVCTVYLATKFRLKMLIITHQIDLLKQFYNEFVEFTNLVDIQTPQKKKRDATGQVVGFFSDYSNPEELDICLLCWQTLGSKNGPKRLEKHRDSWGALVVDEVHRGSAYKYASVLNRINARHRLGMTGTVVRVDDKQKLALDIIGPITITGKVVEVPCVVTSIHTGVQLKYEIREPLPYLYKRLYNSMPRLKTVLKYLEEDVKDGFFICIGFHRGSKEQLQEFTDVLKMMGYKAEAFYGGMKRDREEVLEEFKSGTTQIAVCNEAMLTGINVPRWNVYYSMFPTSNVAWETLDDGSKDLSGNFKQNFSRIRSIFWYTPTMKKKMALIRDFVDENAFCKNSYKKRLKAYKHQGFQVETIHETVKEDLWTR